MYCTDTKGENTSNTTHWPKASCHMKWIKEWLRCFSVDWIVPVYTDAWRYSSLGAGLYIFPCWTSWGFCQPISPACPGPPRWQQGNLVYQSFLQILSSANLKRVHSALYPDHEQDWTQNQPLGYMTCYWSPTSLLALISTLWTWLFKKLPVFLSAYSPSLCFISFSMRILGESVSNALKPHWVKGRAHPLLSLHLPGQFFHPRSSSSWSSMVSLW